MAGSGGGDRDPFCASTGLSKGERLGLSWLVGVSTGFRSGLALGNGSGWMMLGMSFVAGLSSGAVAFLIDGICRTGLLRVGLVALRPMEMKGLTRGATFGTALFKASGGEIRADMSGVKLITGLRMLVEGPVYCGTKAGTFLLVSLTSTGKLDSAGE